MVGDTEHAGDAVRVGTAATLAAQVIEDEEQRLAARVAEPVELPDELLPGVGGDDLPLRDALQEGGVGTIALLTLLIVFEEFDRLAIQVLGPDIQDALDISDTVLTGLASLGGVVLVLCTLPFAWLGDRLPRTKVLGAATLIWSAFVALSGAVVNAFQMAIARSGSGFGASANIPLSPSIVSDAYPLGARTRMLAIEGMGRPLGQVIGPLAAGGLASWIGGDDAWRGVLILFAVPPAVLGLTLLGRRDPKRGRYEQESVLGEQLDVDDPPVRISAAFQRLKKVRTFYFLVVGIGLLGFALVAVPTLMGLLLEERYGYGAYTRGWMIAVSWAGALIAIPLAASFGERTFRRDPRRSLATAGVFVLLYGLFLTVGLRFETIAVLIAFWTIANAFQGAAFTAIRPAIAAVVPYRMRAQAFALVGVYIFLMGASSAGSSPADSPTPGGSAQRSRSSSRPQRCSAARSSCTAAASSAATCRATSTSCSRTRRSGAAWQPTRSTSPCCRCTASMSATARCRCCSASTSRCSAARRSRCSAPTARASRHC